MGRSVTKKVYAEPPRDLAVFFDDLPLIGEEKAEDYRKLLAAIVQAAKPSDAIDWLYVKDVVDITWDIRRERAIKTAILQEAQKEIVLDLLKTTRKDWDSLDAHVHRIFYVRNEVKQWHENEEARKIINGRLTERGHSPSVVLAKAYEKVGAQLDNVERRIASYELRKITVLREIERRNERLARRLQNAASEIIEAEYSEAAE